MPGQGETRFFSDNGTQIEVNIKLACYQCLHFFFFCVIQTKRLRQKVSEQIMFEIDFAQILTKQGHVRVPHFEI